MDGLRSVEAQTDVVAQAALAFGRVLDELHRSFQRIGDDPAVQPALAWLARGDHLLQRLQAYACQAELSSVKVDPGSLLRSLAGTLHYTLDSRIAVSCDVSDGCPPCHADLQALTDALVHLVANARDAMPDGGSLALVAEPSRLADGSPAVRLAVSDSGIGMTEATIKAAVQPFFSSHSTDPLRGLGLPAAEGFARQSGGALELRSVVGRGTTASLVLPRHR